MTSPYLVSELLEAVRDAGMMPSSDESFTSARIIAVMNREQRLYLARLLVGMGESYQVATADVALVAGDTRYRIPSRAVVAGIKLVELVGSSSTVQLHAVPREKVVAGDVRGLIGDYYLEGPELVLLSTPSSGETLRFTYFRRLSNIVTAEEAGEITAINTGTGAVSVSARPTAFTSSRTYDFVQANPHFDTLGADLSATVSGTTITFDPDDLPDDLAVGDYVCLAGETPICQAPLELHEVLVQKAVTKILKSKGDAKAGMAEEDLRQMRDDAIALLQPRVKGAPERVINFNAPGWGRWYGRRFRRP